MYIDSFLKIGHSHQLLEDSVVVGDNRNPYIIVSDGCSGSKWTHLGSNILTKTAEKIFLETGNFNINSIIHQSHFIAKSLGLDDTALDATLMFATIKDRKVNISIYGDGCLFYQKGENKISYLLSYDKNMPYYLSYTLNKERQLSYQEFVNDESEHGINRTLTIDKFEDNNHSSYRDVNFRGFHLELDIEDLKYLILSTDGIDSFEKENISSTFDKLHSFKNFKGDFISRRIKRIIKEHEVDNIFHFDDIGIAGISFEENTDE